MKIITIVTTNPIFIELQYKTINKFIKSNEELEFIVFNDSKDWPDITNFNDVSIKTNIVEICNRLGIKCINIPNSHHINEFNASKRHADSMNFITDFMIHNKDKYLISEQLWKSIASVIDNLSSGGSQGAIRANPYHQFYYEVADSIRMKWTNARILINAATGGYSIVSAISNNPPVSAAKFRRYPVRSPAFALQTNDYDVNWPIFRYAEVLLIYAEASNEINGPNQLAINALNLLRSRARNTNIGGVHRDILPRSLSIQRSIGLVDLTVTNSLVSTQSAFRNYILLERSRELSQEGKRWFD
jgi:hypothetical protein